MARNRVLAAVIVLATALFALGVTLEQSEKDSHDDTATEVAHVEAESEEAGQLEGGEAEGSEEGEELVLGVNLESTPLVVLAVLGSLALAAGAWFRPAVGFLMLLIAVAMLAFAALDVREVLHQVDESNGEVAVLAGFVAALHLLATGLAYSQSQARAD